MAQTVPIPDNRVALRALRAMVREQSPVAALEVFHRELGPVFHANLPGFRPIMVAGAEAARFVLVEARDDFRWRSETDPITRLLGHGLLVADGAEHDSMRHAMHPALHRQAISTYVEAMARATDQISAAWSPDQPVDMLVEMRRIAMLIIMETMFRVDFTPAMDRLWQSLLKALRYISPGLWLLWPSIPRPGFAAALHRLDGYLRQIVTLRRARFEQVKQSASMSGSAPDEHPDLLDLLLAMPGVGDDMVRDQMMTMVVAGHDTSTAALAWALYLLGKHPAAMARAREEVDSVLGGQPPTMERLAELRYLGRVVDETLRLYPPAHLGSRIAARDLEFGGYAIPAGMRVTYSIYVTQRMAEYWEHPAEFEPDRFLGKVVPYSFLPFGGGPRNCIGAAFANVEMKVVLARVLQQFDLTLQPGKVHAHMAVTLEPRPGVRMIARRR